MAEVVPIKDGVLPSVDGEREMVDYCQTQVRKFVEANNKAPTRVAIVLSGYVDGRFHTIANSWDAEDKIAKIENCGVAVLCLLDRALKAD